jgi:heparan-alpha-glucosaminide N-acetyltransferase
MLMNGSANPSSRIASIDILRALTMVLMIFVNDLWSLKNVPEWLGHMPAKFDGMGLADIVFPMFLFIVGLSIPHAIRAREKKGQTDFQIAGHILMRSMALLVMGVFIVNFENINGQLMPVSRQVWEILMIIGFFLIWNIYPENRFFHRVKPHWFQIAGILLLILLAVIYKGGTAENPIWMKRHWWGILGLIGWAYLIGATIYRLSRGNIFIIAAGWFILMLLNLNEAKPFFAGAPDFRIIVGASNHALVMSGVLATALFDFLKKKNTNFGIIAAVLVSAGVILISYGFIVRPFGGISKIYATPSWTSICAGISFAAFGILFLIADKAGYTRWAAIIAPAGRSTLTCYLVPYLVYPIMVISGIRLPEILLTGGIGLIKSVIFALVVVGITALLEKTNVRLKI